MKYRVVIFDLDGTILDTAGDIASSLNMVMGKNGYSAYPVEEVKEFVGGGFRKAVQKALPEGSSDEIMEKISADFSDTYFKHCADTTFPYSGISETISRLKGLGCKLAVVTNKEERAAQKLISLRFPHVFDSVIGFERNRRNKPDPAPVRETLRRVGFSKENAIYVGDTEVDLETARNSQIDCVLVSWGYRSREVLEKLGAVSILSRPEELLDIAAGESGHS